MWTTGFHIDPRTFPEEQERVGYTCPSLYINGIIPDLEAE